MPQLVPCFWLDFCFLSCSLGQSRCLRFITLRMKPLNWPCSIIARPLLRYYSIFRASSSRTELRGLMGLRESNIVPRPILDIWVYQGHDVCTGNQHTWQGTLGSPGTATEVSYVQFDDDFPITYPPYDADEDTSYRFWSEFCPTIRYEPSVRFYSNP